MRQVALIVVTILALGGCAASQSSVRTAQGGQAGADVYAAALADAFDAYEHEVQAASLLTYSSQAEANAVMQSLSDGRFDFQLRAALGRRGLSLADLAQYAQHDPAFFHEQQRKYWGRLESLQRTVDAFATHVAPMGQEALLAADMSD